MLNVILTLFVIMLIVEGFGIGYFLGRGHIVINKVVNKKMSKEMLEKEREQLKQAIEAYNEAIEEVNDITGGL